MSSTPSVSLRRMLVWEALVLLALLLFPTMILGKFLYQLPKRELAVYGMLYVAYVLAAAAHLRYVRHLRGWQSWLVSVLITSAAFAFAFLAIMVTQKAVSLIVVLASFAAALVLLPVPLWRRWDRVADVAIIVVLLGIGLGIARQTAMANASDGRRVATTMLSSAFYPLEIKTYDGYVPRPPIRGGGLAMIRNDVLLGTGDGNFYRVSTTGKEPVITKLPLRAPLNGEEFAAAVGGRYTYPVAAGSGENKGVEPWRFRVADILVNEAADRIRLYVSHHYWYNDRKCFVVRVSSTEMPWSLSAENGNDWQTLYESQPCLPLGGPQVDRNPNYRMFGGEEIGGRLVMLDEHTLLLSVGEHRLTGLASDDQQCLTHWGNLLGFAHSAPTYEIRPRTIPGASESCADTAASRCFARPGG